MASRLISALLLAASFGVAHAQAVAPAPSPAANDAAAAPATTPTPAPAPTPVAMPGVATLGDLDRIQSETVMAEAQRKLAEARKALETAQGVAAATDDGSLDAPVVAGVYGAGSAPYAKFLIPGGGQVAGATGDQLPGGYRVVHVDVDRVVIRDRKGHEVVARFSASLPTRAPPASPPTQSSTDTTSTSN